MAQSPGNTEIQISDFHDAELSGISHSNRDATVLFVFNMPTGGTRHIEFQGVNAFRVQDFGLQNVVYELLLYTADQFSHYDFVEAVRWVKSTSEGNCLSSADEIDTLAKKIKEERMVLFALVPSLGAELVVVARSLAIL